jgi:hypothetical protein
MVMKTISMTFSKQGFFSYVVRCLSVGVAYAITNALTAILLGPLSRQTATWENVAVWTLTGTLLCMVFSPFVIRSTWSRTHIILVVWAVQAFVRSIGLGIEGALFKPASATVSLVGALTGLLIGLLVAWISVALLRPDGIEVLADGVKRSWWGWTWRVLVVGLAYFLFYFIFGATNALLYTKRFYENNPQ